MRKREEITPEITEEKEPDAHVNCDISFNIQLGPSLKYLPYKEQVLETTKPLLPQNPRRH